MKIIQYTKGPDEIELGHITFKRGEAQPNVSDELAAQCLLPQRAAEYGFEEVVQTPKQPAKPVSPATTETIKE